MYISLNLQPWPNDVTDDILISTDNLPFRRWCQLCWKVIGREIKLKKKKLSKSICLQQGHVVNGCGWVHTFRKWNLLCSLPPIVSRCSPPDSQNVWEDILWILVYTTCGEMQSRDPHEGQTARKQQHQRWLKTDFPESIFGTDLFRC